MSTSPKTTETDMPKSKIVQILPGRAAGKFMATAKRLIKWDTNSSTAASSQPRTFPPDIPMVQGILKRERSPHIPKTVASMLTTVWRLDDLHIICKMLPWYAHVPWQKYHRPNSELHGVVVSPNSSEVLAAKRSGQVIHVLNWIKGYSWILSNH